jgi:hypothetical protein
MSTGGVDHLHRPEKKLTTIIYMVTTVVHRYRVTIGSPFGESCPCILRRRDASA